MKRRVLLAASVVAALIGAGVLRDPPAREIACGEKIVYIKDPT